jgi:hypothetical protein
MINILAIAARLSLVGAATAVGYCYGRIHGFNHATTVHMDNLKSSTTEIFSGWVLSAQRELAELEGQLNCPNLTDLDKLRIQSEIDDKQSYILNLVDMLKA